MSAETYAKAIQFHTMSDADYKALRRATKSVFDLMKDGEWHSANEIIHASGTREGLRRMRELREYFHIDGKRYSADNRDWIYRLVAIEQNQTELFTSDTATEKTH